MRENTRPNGSPSPHAIRALRRVFQRLVLIALAAVLVLVGSATLASADGSYGGIWVGGRIHQEYIAQGGPAALGNPTIAESNARDQGKFQTFATGASIYWKASVAGGFAKMVRGAIKDKWAEDNFEWGELGYPTTSEYTLVGGKYNGFQGGSIYWSANNGAHVVWGNIYSQWAAQGYETGSLGYPVTDEYMYNGGYQQLFEGGYLSFNVGPEPDADPNNTSTVLGVDDPQNKFASRYIMDMVGEGDKQCSSTTAASGICVLIGSETDPNTTPPTDARRAPTESPSTTTPPSSLPESPSSTPPSSPTETSDSPTPSAPSTPANPSEPSGAQGSATTTPPAAQLTPTTTPAAASDRPGRVVSGGLAQSPHITPVDDDDPAAAAEPVNPSRSIASELAFFANQVWCANRTAEEFIGKRFYACGVFLLKMYQWTRTPGGAFIITGWTKGWVYMSQQPNATSLQTSVRIGIRQTISTGTGSSLKVNFGMSSVGDSAVTATPSSTGPLTVISNPSLSFVYKQGELDTQPGRITTYQPKITPTFTATGFTPSIRSMTTPHIRCDSLTYMYKANTTPTQGCVIKPNAATGMHNIPVLDYPSATPNATQLMNHILYAQNSGLPGSPLSLLNKEAPVPYLSRILESDSQRGDNSGRACPSKKTKEYKPEPTINWQCDEYPFASTRQGAAQYPKTDTSSVGRTFDWCRFTTTRAGTYKPYLPVFPDGYWNPKGYSACIIDASQNGSGGAQLPTFYRKNRLLAQDEQPDGFAVNAYRP